MKKIEKMEKAQKMKKEIMKMIKLVWHILDKHRIRLAQQAETLRLEPGFEMDYD